MSAEPGAWMQVRLEQLDELLRRHDYRGWDPFDLPNAPLFRAIPERWWLPQLVISKAGSRAAPHLLRRLLRVPPIEDPKTYACAYFAYRFRDSPNDGTRMAARLAALATREPGGGAHWGYDFTWATRSGDINPRRASTIVPGAFAVFALLQEPQHHELVEAALDYYREQHLAANASGGFLSYFAGAKVNTHNANLLGCAALTLGGRALDRPQWLADAAQAASTSIRDVDQRGYLPYADHPSGHWTDCFHHLYVIACATVIQQVNPEVDGDLFQNAIARMRGYLAREFVRDDGLINYYPRRLHPIDPHNYAAAAIFAVAFGDEADLAPPDAERLLRRIDELMWDPAGGHYRHRRHRHRVDSRLFLRWTQAWMFAALAIVSRTMSESTGNSVAPLGNRRGT